MTFLVIVTLSRGTAPFRLAWLASCSVLRASNARWQVARGPHLHHRTYGTCHATPSICRCGHCKAVAALRCAGANCFTAIRSQRRLALPPIGSTACPAGVVWCGGAWYVVCGPAGRTPRSGRGSASSLSRSSPPSTTSSDHSSWTYHGDIKVNTSCRTLRFRAIPALGCGPVPPPHYMISVRVVNPFCLFVD